MSKEKNDFIRLNQDFYLDKNDIGNLISVIINFYYYNIKEYENCLLVDLSYNDSIRPSSMTLFCNGKIETISIKKLSDIQIKFIS